MARLARVVLPGHPHLVTQRGNGGAQTFFSDADYQYYLDLLAEECAWWSVAIWGWCLMPNHVHLLLTPADEDGVRRALARVHRAYAGHIHRREKRRGHFWQGRFGCVALDDDHATAALAYILLNPVRAGLTKRAADWPWSSVHECWRKDGRKPRTRNGLTKRAAIEPFLPDAATLVTAGERGGAEEDSRFATLRRGESIGRPAGDTAFLERAESVLGRPLKPRKRGRKPASAT